MDKMPSLPHILPSSCPWTRHLNSSCRRGAAQWPTIVPRSNSEAGQGWKKHACSVKCPLETKGEQNRRTWWISTLGFLCSGLFYHSRIRCSITIFSDVSSRDSCCFIVELLHYKPCLSLLVALIPAQFFEQYKGGRGEREWVQQTITPAWPRLTEQAPCHRANLFPTLSSQYTPFQYGLCLRRLVRGLILAQNSITCLTCASSIVPMPSSWVTHCHHKKP